MENVSSQVSTQRYPFFWKFSKKPAPMVGNLEVAAPARLPIVVVPEVSGDGPRNECCAPGLRLPGCGYEPELTRIKLVHLRKRLIRNVIVTRDERSAKKVVHAIRQNVSGPTSKGTACGWIALAAHPVSGFCHVHIAHDCGFGGSTCKCAFLNPYRIDRTTIDFEGNFKPFIKRKAKRDLRPIYCEPAQKDESNHAIINILK